MSNQREIIEKLLKEGQIHVVFDSRYPGVRLPDSIERRPDQTIALSLKFPEADIEISEYFIGAELLFGSRRFPTTIPFASIWAVKSFVSGDVYMFQAHVPPATRRVDDDVVGPADYSRLTKN